MSTETAEAPEEVGAGQTEKPTGVQAEKVEVTSMWVKPTILEQLKVIKDSVDLTWSELFEILVEQAIVSGIIPEEGQLAVKAIREKNGTLLPEHFGGRSAFGLGESWVMARGVAAEILKEAKDINENLESLVEAVEDHAEALLDRGTV